MNVTIKQLLESKGRSVATISPDATVYEALKVMAERNIGALVVVEGGRIAGMFSERDYARKVILKDRFSKETLVREIMTDKVMAMSPDETLTQVMALMTEGRNRHLPVLDDGRLAGLISIGDVVSAVISQQEFIIEQLENYIVPGYK